MKCQYQTWAGTLSLCRTHVWAPAWSKRHSSSHPPLTHHTSHIRHKKCLYLQTQSIRSGSLCVCKCVSVSVHICSVCACNFTCGTRWAAGCIRRYLPSVHVGHADVMIQRFHLKLITAGIGEKRERERTEKHLWAVLVQMTDLLFIYFQLLTCHTIEILCIIYYIKLI